MLLVSSDGSPLEPKAELFAGQCFLVSAALDHHAAKFTESDLALAHCCALSACYRLLGIVHLMADYLPTKDEALLKAEIEKISEEVKI